VSGPPPQSLTAVFFVSYVAFEVPSNLVLKRLRPSIYIPGTMVAWALFQIFMGLVKNYGQLLALRFCLGIFEAGLFPGLNFYLNGWYRRDELSKRTAIFFAGAVLAGAFGGIFGYALGKMDGIGGKAGWSWIFVSAATFQSKWRRISSCLSPATIRGLVSDLLFVSSADARSWRVSSPLWSRCARLA